MIKKHSFEKGEHLRLAYLYGGKITYQPGQTLGPRLLSDWELVLITEGLVTYRANGQEYAAGPGSMILARPGFEESYRWDPQTRTRHAYFHFSIEELSRDWPDPEAWPIVLEESDPILPALFDHVLKRIVRHSDWPIIKPTREDCRVVETLLSLFIMDRTTENAVQEPMRPEPVNRAIKWMRELIDEAPLYRVTLSQLAKRSGVSAKHLCRLFQTHFGCSPMRVFQLLRLQLALALVIQSNLSVNQIAKRCGFEDALYFSRCFKKAFEIPPSQARKNFKQGLLPPQNPLPSDITPRVYW